MSEKKAYVVTFHVCSDDEGGPLRVLSSKMRAQQYIESEVKRFLKDRFKPDNGYWQNDLEYWYDDRDEKFEYHWEISEIDIDDGIDLPPLPEVEKENNSLKAENISLRKRLGHVEGLNAAARCYLTMWDGGWDYAKEHVIENMHAAKAILEDGEVGNAKIGEMFRGWKEQCKA